MKVNEAFSAFCKGKKITRPSWNGSVVRLLAVVQSKDGVIEATGIELKEVDLKADDWIVL